MPATRGEVEGVGGGGLPTIKNLWMTQQSELGGRWVRFVVLDVGEQVGGFPSPSGDLGPRNLVRGHAATSAMVTVASAAQSHCWARCSLRRPSGHPGPAANSRQKLTSFFFFLIRLGAPEGLRGALIVWKLQAGSAGRCGSPCCRAFATVYLHRKRSRWLCRQRACVCQPMEQERLEGLLLRGGAETQEEATGVGGWGWGGSDGVRRRRWGVETARIESEAVGRSVLKQWRLMRDQTEIWRYTKDCELKNAFIFSAKLLFTSVWEFIESEYLKLRKDASHCG